MARRCCCLGACAVFTDVFDDAAGPGPNSDWTKYGGTWTYLEPHLEESGTSGSLILTVAQSNSREQAVSASVETFVAGDKVWLICNAVDDENLLYVEAEQNAGDTTVRFYKRVGGADTLLYEKDVTQIGEVGIGASFRLCVSDESMTWVGLAPGAVEVFVYLCDPPLNIAGKKAGIGNGGSSALEFTSFQLLNFWGVDGAEPEDYQCCLQQCLCIENGQEYCISEHLLATFIAFGGCKPPFGVLDGSTMELDYVAEKNIWITDPDSDQPACLLNGYWELRCVDDEVCGSQIPVGKKWMLSLFKRDSLETEKECKIDLPCMSLSHSEVSATCNPLSLVFPTQSYAIGIGPPADCTCCDGEVGKSGSWYVVITER